MSPAGQLTSGTRHSAPTHRDDPPVSPYVPVISLPPEAFLWLKTLEIDFGHGFTDNPSGALSDGFESGAYGSRSK